MSDNHASAAARAEARIRALAPGGMRWDPAPLRRALARRGDPHIARTGGRPMRYVHIAGTNGKGSVARMLQCMLSAAGYVTGLYTSPAPLSLRDTVTVDGKPIPEEAFARLAGGLFGDGLTEFELTTVLALQHFHEADVDIAVVECGLGGRDDATNVIPPPLAAVITPVSLDHVGILGGTVEAITEQKCGIFKSPCAVVTSPAQDERALAVIFEQAAGQGLTVRMPCAAAPLVRAALGETAFLYDGRELSVPLTGAFQRDNALTAIEAARALEPHGFSVSPDAVAAGLARAVLPLRQEVARRDPLVLLDGAHNPQAVAALADTLERHGVRGVTMIAGMLADKDAAPCLALLAPYCAAIICCTPPHPRALDAADLAGLARAAAPACRVSAAADPAAALAQWDGASPLLAAGSFYTAAAVREALRFP